MRRLSLAPFLATALLSAGTAQAQWTTTTPLSPPRSGLAATAVGGYALFAGGVGANVFDTVNIYDTDLNTSTFALPGGVRDSLVATANPPYALFGGGLNPLSATVDVYDSSAGAPTMMGAWCTTTFPSGVARHSLTATSVGPYSIFAGGKVVGGFATDAVDIYDSTKGAPCDPAAWSSTTLPLGRWNMASASVAGYALFTGGIWFDGVSTHMVDTVNIYDSSMGDPTNPAAWSTHTLSQARVSHSAVTLGNKILFAGGVYVCGGATGTCFSDVVDVYDSSMGAPTNPGAWSVQTLSEARHDMAATTVGDRAIFAGGRGMNQQNKPVPRLTIDMYDDVSGTWTTALLSKERTGAVAATVGNTVLVAAGGSKDGSEGIVDIYGPVIGKTFCSPNNANTSGLPAVLTAIGSDVATDNELTVWATDLPKSKFGMFITSEFNTFVPNPGGSSGNLCIAGGKIARFSKQVQNSGPKGQISITVDLSKVPASPDHTVVAGETWNFQAWFRDSTPFTSNFTDAVAILFK